MGAVILAELENAGSVLEAFKALDGLAEEVRGLPDDRPFYAGFAAGGVFRARFPQPRAAPDFPEVAH